MVHMMPQMMAKLLVDNIENFELWNALKCMFDIKSKMYQNHALGEVNSILFTNSNVPYNDDEGNWRNELKEGSLVDCVKIEPMMEIRCWARAVVVKRFENKNSDDPPKVKVTFEDDKASYDR